MFLNNKPARLGPASKARLNTHTHTHSHHPHKLDNIDRNKRSPDGNPPLPGSSQSQPAEVLVFNTSSHHGGGGRATRAGHYQQTLPEVPNFEEIEKFMKDSWDERIARINDPSLNLKVLWMKSYAQEEQERLEAEQAAAKEAAQGQASGSGSSASSASSTSSTSSSAYQSQNHTPKQKNSPQHNHHNHNNSKK